MDQPAVGIIDETFVTRKLDHSLSGFVGKADIQNRVHHARHGELCSGTAGNEQGIFVVTKFFSGKLLNPLHGNLFLFQDFLHKGDSLFQIGQAGTRCDCEPRGYRNTDTGHFSQVGAFSTEEGSYVIPIAAYFLFSGLNFFK